MRVIERTIEHPEDEGVILEYAKMENGEEILITRKYAKEIEDYFMKEDDNERV